MNLRYCRDLPSETTHSQAAIYLQDEYVDHFPALIAALFDQQELVATMYKQQIRSSASDWVPPVLHPPNASACLFRKALHYHELHSDLALFLAWPGCLYHRYWRPCHSKPYHKGRAPSRRSCLPPPRHEVHALQAGMTTDWQTGWVCRSVLLEIPP